MHPTNNEISKKRAEKIKGRFETERKRLVSAMPQQSAKNTFFSTVTGFIAPFKGFVYASLGV